MDNSKFWNIIFLIDEIIPTKIVLLKRAETKKFAPNYYTGIGGKVEKGETLLDSAYRELKEETGITDVNLKEFARVVIDNDVILSYFYGVFVNTFLPKSDDGILEWIKTHDLLDKKIIPSTLLMCKEWKSRDFTTKSKFTLFLEKTGEKDGVSVVKIKEIKEGLLL